MAAAVQRMVCLLTALRNCTTLPNVLCLPELVCGGLVWILMSSKPASIGDILAAENHSQGWAMFASVFCFVMTIVWLLIFACGAFKKSSRWAAADFFYHLLAFIIYLSASGVLTNLTFAMNTWDWEHIVNTMGHGILDNLNPENLHKIDISAMVFSFISTLLYLIHCILSAKRWRSL